ncbi:hypothetical protein [Coleofasciculus sp. H7-2]|uniref:hypothetical protein n=1 Tax=Coleofasciculus sp. H7-2 TaxID=3351545 RepID=UPI00366A66FC
MCVNCLLVSALMFFTPSVSEVPSNSANQVALAQETQVAIAQLVKNLPNSSETLVLRDGLGNLQVKLAKAKNDAEAQDILDTELASLSQRIAAAPNAGEINEALEDILIVDDNEQLIKGLKVKTSPNKSQKAATSKVQSLNWGWLH